MIVIADHQGGPPGPEPAMGAPVTGDSAAAPDPAASRAFAAVLAAGGGEDRNPPEKTGSETEGAEDTPLNGTVAADAADTKALVARAGEGTSEKTSAPRVPGTAAQPRDDGSIAGPTTVHPDDAPQKPQSATSRDGGATDVVARGDPVPARPPGDARDRNGGASATTPLAATLASGEKTAAVAEPTVRPVDSAPLFGGQRPGSAQITASTMRFSVVSGAGPGSADMIDDAPVAPAQPRLSAAAPRTPPVAVPESQTVPLPATSIVAQAGATPLPEATSPVATALMPVTTALRVAEALAAASERSIAPATSGPRVAPAITGTSLAPPLHAAPLQAAPPPPGFSAALSAAIGGAADPLGLADSALGAPEHRGPAPLASALAPPVQAATAGQDIPRQIAVQIARAAEGGPGGARGTVELSLSPEELGRVRLRLHPSEAGLSVTITADRPETLDLMRRNIDLLAREFLDIGYEDAQFDFTRGGQGTDDDNAAASTASALTAAPPDTAQTALAARLVLGDRLDIRL